MAYFYRVIGALWFVAVAGSAFAQTCTQYQWTLMGGAEGSCSGTQLLVGNSPTEVAAAWVARQSGCQSGTGLSYELGSCPVPGPSDTSVMCTYYANQTWDGAHLLRSIAVSRGECVGQADALCPPLAGNPAGGFNWEGLEAEVYICDQFQPSNVSDKPYCLVKAVRDMRYQVDGVWQSAGESSYTGEACAIGAGGTGTSVDPKAVGTDLGAGQAARPGTPCDGYFGLVNGVETCIPKTGVDGIGSTPVTSTSTVSSPDGTSSQTITRETVCEAGACNTTTTTTTINNGTSSTTVKTESKPIGEYCAEHPTDKSCGGSGGPGLGESESGFGGTCEANFTCTGDAVSCAIARATNEINCAFSPGAEPLQVYSTAANAGTPTIPNQDVEISESLFDTTDALGTAPAGLTDKAITVMGTSVTLPLSNLNPYLRTLGNILVAISFLLAIRILIRG